MKREKKNEGKIDIGRGKQRGERDRRKEEKRRGRKFF